MELDYTEQHWGDKKCPKVDCKKDTCKCGLERVFLSAALGDDKKGSPVAPKNGDYCNAIVVYEANNHIYLYSKDGVPTLIELEGDGFEEKLNELEEGLAQEILDRQAADATLQGEIDDIKNSPDVVDIVPTYAALQAYDTSKLGNNDIVRVLQDETHGGESTYYRWNTTTETWTFIGSVGDYYTKGQVDTLLAGKQDTLTAGSNITIENDVISATGTTYTAGANIQISPENVISATDTTYTHFTGATSSADGTAGLVPAPVAGDDTKFLSGDGTWQTVSPYTLPIATTTTLGGIVVGNNLTIDPITGVLDATDTTYSAFVGTDGQTAGTAGLVPAPATTDAGKFLKADGTWDTAGGGSGPTVVQTTGTSTTDVMSQNATSTMVYADPADKTKIIIGAGAGNPVNQNPIAIGASATSGGNNGIAIGTLSVGARSGVALGDHANANYLRGSVALGAYSQPTSAGEVNIGTTQTSEGYGSSNYRLLTGVHDPQSAHDAATKGYVDGKVLTGAGAPTTSTVGTVGQIYEDTTNGDLYICIDATNPYVWEQVGAGGSGPTVVQTTGTSTTDVMSQNATTSMVFADPSNKTKVQIGNSNTFIDGAASNGIVIGANAKNYGDLSLCAGEGAIVNYPKGVCLGARTTANGNFSIALGAGATTSAQGELNIGTGSTYTTSGYNNSNYRLIRGVYDAQGDHDAVTLGQLNGRVKQNAGAPTTSTVGTVGQLLEDTTNGKLYQCTAIDNTDPNNPVYTWTEVGAGGGGGVTVVQSTGTSQTDVMSQNAASSMVFADPGTDTRVQIGSGASGDWTDAVVIGSGATSYATNTTIIGTSATARGNGVAIGKNSKAGNTASQTNATAVGYNAQALANGAIAIGRDSNATAQGEMNIGTTNTGWGYNSSNYRLLSGVYDPVGAHDAATKGYVDGLVGNCRELTSADYNYDSDGDTVNDTVALWLLPPGVYWWEYSFGSNGGVKFTTSSSGTLIDAKLLAFSQQVVIGYYGDANSGFNIINAFSRNILTGSSDFGWAPYVPYVVNTSTGAVVNFQTSAIPVGRGDVNI